MDRVTEATMFRKREVNEAERFWLDLRDAEEREIGDAFANVLMPRVRGGLGALADLAAVPQDRARLLTETYPSVEAAGAAGAVLARAGLTPADVAAAAWSASCLLRRLIGRGRAPFVGVGGVMPGEISGNLAWTVEVPHPVAEALTEWLLAAARDVPLLLPGFRATYRDGIAWLADVGRDDGPLRVAWAAP